MEQWCLPLHPKQREFDQHCLLRWPLAKQRKQRPVLLRDCKALFRSSHYLAPFRQMVLIAKATMKWCTLREQSCNRAWLLFVYFAKWDHLCRQMSTHGPQSPVLAPSKYQFPLSLTNLFANHQSKSTRRLVHNDKRLASAVEIRNNPQSTKASDILINLVVKVAMSSCVAVGCHCIQSHESIYVTRNNCLLVA